ncbi:MAG: glycosyltransferase family 2 protein [Acidobacteria bacterium]|nr:glycosyltransferase family 2 protein [Acidobacteriota bacterium]MBS1867185.1 glycosyltransferase family 2 protein [Acidobacteriota bacterium]
MNQISFCMITLNGEKHLARALKSALGVADEIVVVDCGSMDRTLEIAHEFGAKVMFREWTNFSEQRNFAVSQAKCEWIFTLDADEELSEPLRNSLRAWKTREAAAKIYEMPRLTFYIGGWIRHSGWYPNLQRRLYRKDSAKYSGIVHETLEFAGKPGRLQGDLLHYTIENLAEHEAKVEKYSALAAQKMFEEGKRRWRAAVWFAAPWTFLQSFVIRCGFLDGYRGALIARMAARSVRLKFTKLGGLVREDRLQKNR